MRSEILRIFVSSTWLDLGPERRAVEDAIHRMSSAKFIGMEYFGSRAETPEEASLDEVDRCDLYVGIIGGRYGSGITEAEYRRARERDLPCFVYFKDDSTVQAEWREADKSAAERLARFKQQLMTGHIVAPPFKTPAELAVLVRDDLYRWFFDNRLSAQIAGAAVSIVALREDRRAVRLDTGSEHGAIATTGEPPRLRPRPSPLRPSVRPFRGLLDRASETDAAAVSLQSLLPVEFYGQPGIGKTSLLRHLAYHPPDGRFADGVVYLDQVGERPAGDVLQFLFDSFYESDPGYKPREAELLNLLRDKRALVVMDEVELPRADVQRVMNAAPDCAFLLSGAERHLFGEGRAVMLPGLPAKEAVELLERELGRTLSPAEEPAAQSICSLLEGHPLNIAQTAAMVLEQNRPLDEIARDLQQSRNPAESANRRMAASHSGDERRVMAALAALDGAPARAETIAAIAGLNDAEATLDGLLRQRLIEAGDAGYRLTDSMQAILEADWNLTEWRERAVGYLAEWAERNQRDREMIRERSAPMLSIFNWAAQTGRHREAIRLGKAVEGSLVLSGQWEEWDRVLQQIQRSAEATGDSETRGWALHQAGTRALAMGDDGAAREMLAEALEIRSEMGDHAAASVTRHNLDWLIPPAVPHQPAAKAASGPLDGGGPAPGPKPASGPGFLIKLAGGALVAGLATWALWPEAKAQFSPERLSFAAQELNRPGAPLTAELTNGLSEPLQIGEARIAGNAAADFAIVENGCLNRSLGPGERCAIVVSFNPAAEGERRAVLQIFGTPEDRMPELPLAGAAVRTAVSPEVSPSAQIAPDRGGTPDTPPTPAPVPRLEISSNSLDFGEQQPGSESARPLSLFNAGDAALTVNDISIAGSQSNEFSAGAECLRGPIAPGGDCTINVTFRPRSEGRKSANLTVVTNDAGVRRSIALTGTAVPRPVVQPPQIVFFTARPSGITEGEETSLCYSMSNVSLASISPSIGGLSNLATACVPVRLRQTTTFTLNASGSDGRQTSQQFTVEVSPRPQPPPVIEDFSARPQAIIEGDETELCYSIGNAVRAFISPSIGNLKDPRKDCVKIRLRETTTFTLTATGGDGRQTSRQLTVRVAPRPQPPPVIEDFSARPQSITEGDETEICYSIGNAVRAFISPSIGNLRDPRMDCVKILLRETTTFTLTATGGDGRQTSRQLTVRVAPRPQPSPEIEDFSSRPPAITEGEETRLCYSIKDAASASISPSIGDLKDLKKDCVSIRLRETTTFTLTVIGGDGRRASRQVSVRVAPRPQPPPKIEFFVARPSSVAPGRETSICYSIQNAAHASISPSVGALRNPSKDCVSTGVKQTTTFTLTAFGRDGRQDSQRLIVRVTEPARPPRIVFFRANPVVINPGSSTELCYGVADADEVFVEPWVANLKPARSSCFKTPALKSNTTFTLTAANSEGQKVSHKVSVTVTTIK